MKLQKFYAPACIHSNTNHLISAKCAGVCVNLKEILGFGRKRVNQFRKNNAVIRAIDKRSQCAQGCVVRVFYFKDTESWLMHEALCRDLAREIDPRPCYYRLEKVCTVDLHANEFLRRLMGDDGLEDLLGMPIFTYTVVEVFDGFQSVCYYKTVNGFQYMPYFHTEQVADNDFARKGGAAA